MAKPSRTLGPTPSEEAATLVPAGEVRAAGGVVAVVVVGGWVSRVVGEVVAKVEVTAVASAAPAHATTQTAAHTSAQGRGRILVLNLWNIYILSWLLNYYICRPIWLHIMCLNHHAHIYIWISFFVIMENNGIT